MISTRLIKWALLAVTLIGCTDQQRFYPNSYVFETSPYSGETDPKKLKLSLSPNNVDFGIQSTQTINHSRFILKNEGDLDVRDLKFATNGDAAFTVRSGNYPGSDQACGAVLAAGQQCSVDVTYRPTALVRSTGSLKIGFNGAGEMSADLDGSGSDIATLRFDNSLQTSETYFGKVAPNTPIDRTIYVRYFGARAASGITFSQILPPFQLIQNTCPSEVQGQDCKLVIRFSASSGSFSQKLKVAYFNSSYAAEDNHLLTAEIQPVVSPAVLSFDSGSGAFGRSRMGLPVTKNILVRKSGSLPARSVRYSTSGSVSFSIQGMTCGTEVSANCNIEVRYVPNTTAQESGQLRLDYDSGQGVSASTVPLTGAGGNLAVLTLSPSTDPVNFGSLLPGESRSTNFSLTNAPDSIDATAISYSITMVANDFGLVPGCGSVSGGGSCGFSANFNPTTTGTRTGQLKVVYYNGNNSVTLTRSLTGLGLIGGSIGGSTSLNFGDVFVNEYKELDLNLSFVGSGPNTDLSVSLPDGFSRQGGTCGTTMTNACSLRLRFSPTQVRSYSGNLVVSYNDAAGVAKTFTSVLTGRGVSRAVAVLSVDSTNPVDFGDVRRGQVKNVRLTLRHSGDVAATGILIGVSNTSGSFFAPGSGGTCSGTLSPSARSCVISIDFKPTAAGVAAGNLTVSYNDSSAQRSTSVVLTGKGIEVTDVQISGGSFPDTAVDGLASINATVTNNGNLAASNLVIGSAPAPFSVTAHSCGSSLAAGTSCAVQLRFNPRGPKQHTGTLVVSYSDGSSTRQASLWMTGNATVDGFVKVNGYTSCARTSLGQLKCWGANNYGQLGLGDARNRGANPGEMGTSLPTIQLGTDRWVKDVAIGYWHVCAILDNNQTKCWGANHYGQLGLGSAANTVGASAGEMGDALAPVNLGSGVYATSLSLGYTHSCALLNNGRVKCWGQNDEGQLGLGDLRIRGRAPSDMTSLPYVELGRNALQISTDSSHVCALLDDKSVRCWGNNFFGQLGTGDQNTRGDAPGEMGTALPTVALGSGFVADQVVTGGAFTCVRSAAGQVKCFGRNEAGILGRQYCQDSDGRIGLCGDARFPLETRAYGTRAGQLGDQLVAVDLGTNVVVASLSSGNSHVCAQLSDNRVKCWGQNTFGQLGYGDTDNRGVSVSQMGNSLPAIPFSGAWVPETVVSGGFHNCIRFTNRAVKCFGQNRFGNLGVGDTSDRGDEAGETGDALPSISF